MAPSRFMARTLMHFTLSAALLLIFFVPLAPGQDDGVANQFDPGLNVAFDLNERVRLDFFTGREKSEELETGKGKIGGSISFRTKPFFKRFLDALDTDKSHVLVFSTGYEYARASESGVTKKEHKIMFDATVRWAFKGKLLLSNRNRAEFRWVSNEFHFRIRERFILERPTKVPVKLIKREITPFVAGEAFWDHRFKKWNIFKFGAGVQVPLFRRTGVDVNYHRQNCTTCPDRATSVLAATLNVYLRRKKK